MTCSSAKPSDDGVEEVRVSPAERMQRAIAAAMTRANDEIPHYYVEHTIDMGNAMTRGFAETNASLDRRASA